MLGWAGATLYLPCYQQTCFSAGSMGFIQILFSCLLFCIVSTSAGVDRSDFPLDFMFGTASSAYQYEGAWREGGKGLSNWDAITHSPGNVKDGSNGDVADDQYHKYLEDIELMASLGVDSYRFSISWSRILPEGNGEINQAGIEYYNNFINALLRNGIQPFVTLFHFNLPNALEDSYGGWKMNEFQDFKMKDDFKIAMMNEFMMKDLGLMKYFLGMEVYQGKDEVFICQAKYAKDMLKKFDMADCKPLSTPIAHGVILCRNDGAKIVDETLYRSIVGSLMFLTHTRPDIAYSVSLVSRYMTNPSEEHMKAAKRILRFLDPIVLGDYPSEMREGLGLRLPAFDSEMSENLAESFDFIGINQYTTLYASASPTPSLDATTRFYPDSMVYLTGERRGIPIGEPTGMGGLYVVPRGIQSMVEYVTQIYNRPPVIITENGYAESKNSFAKLQEALEDVRRIHFHSDNLNHLAKAIRNGSDVRGYFMWSLLDNFEWRFGYTMRFGLYYVDMHSQNRYPKKSAQWLKQFLRKDESRTI